MSDQKSELQELIDEKINIIIDLKSQTHQTKREPPRPEVQPLTLGKREAINFICFN